MLETLKKLIGPVLRWISWDEVILAAIFQLSRIDHRTLYHCRLIVSILIALVPWPGLGIRPIIVAVPDAKKGDLG